MYITFFKNPPKSVGKHILRDNNYRACRNSPFSGPTCGPRHVTTGLTDNSPKTHRTERHVRRRLSTPNIVVKNSVSLIVDCLTQAPLTRNSTTCASMKNAISILDRCATLVRPLDRRHSYMWRAKKCVWENKVPTAQAHRLSSCRFPGHISQPNRAVRLTVLVEPTN